MSKQKINSGLLSSGAITEEAMLAYLSGALSAADKAQFEQLLANDPFAQEALEGLQSIAQPTMVQPTIATLQNKVRERAGIKEAKTIKLHWATYAWAAAVVGLLIGVGVLMINLMDTKGSTLAENKEATPNEITLFDANEKETKLEQGPIATEERTTKEPQLPSNSSISESIEADDAEQSKKLKLKDEPTAASETNSVATSANVVTKTMGNEGAARAGEKGTMSQSKEAEFVEPKVKKESAAPSTTVAISDAMTVSESKNKATVSMDDAMKEFNSGNYKKASEQFDALLKIHPENAEALYFGGISDYINGNTKKSEKNFDKLLTGSKGYAEGSKWYKANILLKKGKKEEAKKLLQDLSQTNGSYKERAVKKLTEVQ